VNFEFSYRTVQSSPNLPKINVDVQLDSKTIEGKHVQIFKDLIDDYLLTQSPSPEVTDQLIALKEAIPNDSSINTTNLNTFHQFLTNPIQSKY